MWLLQEPLSGAAGVVAPTSRRSDLSDMNLANASITGGVSRILSVVGSRLLRFSSVVLQ